MPNRPSTRYDLLIEDGRLDDDADQRAVLKTLDALALKLEGYQAGKTNGGALSRIFKRKKNGEALRSVYVWGGVGRGKTLIMDMFHHAVNPVSKHRVHFHRFMQDVHRDIHAFRKDQDKGLLASDADPIAAVAKRLAKEASVLCLDEFQVKDITDAMILGRLFEAILAQGCVVVATSNIPPSDLYHNGLNRNLFLPFIEFIEKEFDVIEIGGDTDFRLQKLSGQEIYFCPLGPGATGRLELLWRQVTGSQDAESGELMVQGRILTVERAARGAAWFSFADLCEQPLGNADYLAIATNYDVVFIEGVPELTEEQGNAARRFINLIDSLYDEKVRVVISAETPPEGIYRFADTPVEFARTVSRINEMRSAQWWEQAL